MNSLIETVEILRKATATIVVTGENTPDMFDYGIEDQMITATDALEYAIKKIKASDEYQDELDAIEEERIIDAEVDSYLEDR